MPLSEQEALTIATEMKRAKKANGTPAYTDDEIEMTLNELHGEQDLPMSLRSGGFANWKEPVRFFGPMLAGTVASGLASRSGLVTQGISEAGGITAGDMFSRVVTGEKQDVIDSATTGVFGATVGTGYRGTTRFTGELGRVSGMAVQEAGRPSKGMPAYNKVVRPKPRTTNQAYAGISDEASIVSRTRAAVRQLRSRLTPEREQKVQLLKDAEAQGARVDAYEIVKALDDSLIRDAFTPEAKAFNDKVIETGINLIDIAARSEGKLTPTQVDSMISTQLRPKIYKSSGQPSDTMIAEAYANAEAAAKAALDKAIPGPLGELNRKIAARLKSAEQAERLFGSDKESVINTIRNLYGGGNEEKAAAFKFLADNTDPKLKRDILKLYTQRQFTTDIRKPGSEAGFWGNLFSRPLEWLTKASAPLQPYVGPTAAGVQASQFPDMKDEAIRAFMDAMADKKKPQEQPNP